MEENKFIFNNTDNFLICFNRECTTCSECLRYVVGQEIAQRRTWGLTVSPVFWAVWAVTTAMTRASVSCHPSNRRSSKATWRSMEVR